jgi:uncharacterized integral membrane protein
MRGRGSIVGAVFVMNAKLIFKTLFFLLMLLLLVMMGIHNKGSVSFALPPFLRNPISQPAAIMYFAFFAAGFLTSTVLSAGGKSGGGASRPAKPSKS